MFNGWSLAMEGLCVDCGSPCLVVDMYLVCPKLWEKAGMKGWAAGCLHLECLERRLGRKVTWKELYMRNTGQGKFIVQTKKAIKLWKANGCW